MRQCTCGMAFCSRGSAAQCSVLPSSVDGRCCESCPSPVGCLLLALIGALRRPSQFPLTQDWNAQQKEKKEKMLAGWKPEDEEEEDKEEGEWGRVGWAASQVGRGLTSMLAGLHFTAALL